METACAVHVDTHAPPSSRSKPAPRGRPTFSRVLSLSSTKTRPEASGWLCISACSTSALGRPETVCEKIRSAGKLTLAMSLISSSVKWACGWGRVGGQGRRGWLDCEGCAAPRAGRPRGWAGRGAVRLAACGAGCMAGQQLWPAGSSIWSCDRRHPDTPPLDHAAPQPGRQRLLTGARRAPGRTLLQGSLGPPETFPFQRTLTQTPHPCCASTPNSWTLGMRDQPCCRPLVPSPPGSAPAWWSRCRPRPAGAPP
jgi:hypothetical protein